MNILQIVSELNESENARDVISSTRFFTLNGHKMIVVSRKDGRVKDIDSVGARFYAVNARARFFMLPVSLVRLCLIIKKENIDIVHSRDASSAFLGFLASRITGKVFVSTLYDYAIKSLKARSALWAKRVLCFSEGEAKDLVMKKILNKNKMKVVPRFLDEKALFVLNNEKGSFNIRAELYSEDPMDLQNLVRAIAVLSRTAHNLKVYLALRLEHKDKDHAAKLDLLIKRHVLKDTIKMFREDPFTERIPPVNIFLQVNDKHKVSVKSLLAAKLSGIPVIATESAWIDEYIDRGKTGLVVKIDNPQEVSAKILGLYRDNELAQSIAIRAKESLKEKKDIKNVMALTKEAYDEAIAAKNILIIKISAAGDAILITPSIRAIREKFPLAKIKILTSIETREVFSELPYIDEMITCDFNLRDRGSPGLLGVVRKVRSEDFDISVDFQNNKKSHLLAFLACIPKRYGYDNGKLSFLLNRKIKDTKEPVGPVEHQLRVLKLLGIYNVNKELELPIKKEDEKWAETFMASHWLKKNTKLVAFNLGSSPRWISKMWPVEYFAELSNMLFKELDVRTVIIGKEAEDPRLQSFLRMARSKPINASGKTTISRLAALVKRCDALLSSDSAPMHVAAAVGTPFVGLFGPTDPARHVPPAGNHAVIKKDFPCVPCYHTHCDKGYICMQYIKPDEVYEALRKTLHIKT